MAKQTKTNSHTTSTADTIAAVAAMGGKMPPQAVDFEEDVLGALLIEKDAFQEVVETLQPEHFYKDEHQRIYAAMVKLNTENQPTDLLMVANELKRRGELEQVGGRSALVALTGKVASAVNIDHHARIIFQKYLQREVISIGTKMQKEAYADEKDVDDLLEEAESDLFTLSQGSMKKDVTQISPVIDQALAQMRESAKRTDSLSGVPSGFISIDRVTSGWQPATMVVIAARPAMGKTAFVLSMARKMAIDHNVPLAIFSLEMSNLELVKRLITAETEITSDKIKSGRLTVEEWRHLENSLGRLNNAPIFIDDTPGLSVFDLRSKARILKKKHNIGAIIIDYLQLMTASAMRPGNRQEEVSMISRSLKGLAKELNIPVIALSQLNRSVESRTGEGADGKRPQLSDLRESGAIEQDADMVCFIHRPEYYKITQDAQGNSLIGVAQFLIAKHRSGALADINLRFQADLVRFEEQDVLTRALKSMGQKTMTEQTFVSKMNNETEGDAGQVPDFTSQGNDNFPF